MEQFPHTTFQFCHNMEEAKDYLSEAVVFATYGVDLTPKLLSQAKKLRWIMVLSAGLEEMPLSQINERKIIVTNARGIHKIPMAEYAISMLLQVSRQEKILIKNEQENKWDKSLRMDEINSKTILIAGTGAIGQEVARLAKAFRMKTIGVSRSGKAVAYFDETYITKDMLSVLPKADFIVSVLPSTKETKQMYKKEHFKAMADHAIFLNMGRGDVVEEEVLLHALDKCQISHAVLDVFATEPLPENHPFWEHEKVTVTPHLSGVSVHYMERALDIFKENLQSFLQDKTCVKNLIDVTRGY